MKLSALPLPVTTILVIGRYAGRIAAFESVASDLLRGHDPYWELLYEYTAYKDPKSAGDNNNGEEEKFPNEREAYTAEGRQWGYIRDFNSQFGKGDKPPCANVDVNARTTLIKEMRTEQDIFRLPYIQIDQPQIIGWHFFEDTDCDGDPFMTKDLTSRGYSYVMEEPLCDYYKMIKGQLAVLSTWDLTVNENPPVFVWYGPYDPKLGRRPRITRGPTSDWESCSGSSQPNSNGLGWSPEMSPFKKETEDSKLLKDSPYLSSEASSPQLPFPLPFQSFSPIYANNPNIGYLYTNQDFPQPRQYTPTEVAVVFKTTSPSRLNPLEIPFDRRSNALEPLTSTGKADHCFSNPAYKEGIMELGLFQYKFVVDPDPINAMYQPVGIIFFNHYYCGKDISLKAIEANKQSDPTKFIVHSVSRKDGAFNNLFYERRWKFAEPLKAQSFQLVLAQTSIGDSGHGSVTQHGITFEW